MPRDIIDRLNAVAERRKISRPKIAQRSGLPRMTVHRVLSRLRPNFSHDTVDKIARALGYRIVLKQRRAKQ